jgi:8-oxo-dGTP pyrophosphatase MutT (NUDIX family)
MTVEHRRSLPPDVAETARRIASGELTPADPKPAATVVLLRDGREAGGPEVYLLRRVATMLFAPRMHVFPGGGVDPRDASDGTASLRWAGPAPAEWAARLSVDEALARALVCAAVRETFEESGVLLAGPDVDTVVDDTSGDDWEADRLGLIDRSLAFTAFLERRRLVLRTDLLRAWAQWITPEPERRRYDARFFVAQVPGGQRPREVGGETDAAGWLPVRVAIERHRRGELGMFPPTIATLVELAGYRSVAEVLAASATRVIEPLLPRIVLVEGSGPDGEVRLVMPGDPEFEGDRAHDGGAERDG